MKVELPFCDYIYCSSHGMSDWARAPCQHTIIIFMVWINQFQCGISVHVDQIEYYGLVSPHHNYFYGMDKSIHRSVSNRLLQATC